MPRVVADADAWAAANIGRFFTASGETSGDGDLTGQCVTLNKWFLAEMTSVPRPFAARGDARYVGKRLVAEGHAFEVPFEQRQEGDFACFEYGQYGHIGVVLSNNRIFEQNANVGGVARRLVDGAYVYAARIGSFAESWRTKPNIYRIKSYTEVDVMDETDAKEGYRSMLHREPENDLVWRGWVGKRFAEMSRSFRGSNEWLSQNHAIVFFADREKQLNDARNQLNAANDALKAALANDASDKQAIAEAQAQAQDALKNLNTVTDNFNMIKSRMDELEAEKELATKTGNAFTRWIGDLLNGIMGKK